MNTYYDTLGVPKTATPKAIKKSFFTLSRKYHPDRNSASTAKATFQSIREAYETLIDEEKRKEYDSVLTRMNSTGNSKLQAERGDEIQKEFEKHRSDILREMDKEKARKEQEINELKQNFEKQSMNAEQQHQAQMRQYQEEQDRKEAIRQKELEAARREQELLIKNASSRHDVDSSPSHGAWDNSRRNINGHNDDHHWSSNTHHHEHNGRNREPRNSNREYYSTHPQAYTHDRHIPQHYHHSPDPIAARLEKIERTQETILEKLRCLLSRRY